MDRLLLDLRHSLRSLTRHPGYALIALLTLGIGVGANTAIFSVIDTVLLRPLPYPDPASLVHVDLYEAEDPDHPGGVSLPDLNDLNAQTQLFSHSANYSRTSVTLTGTDQPEVVRASEVTDGLLALFRVPPQLGRDLTASESGPNGAKVVVLGDALWRGRLGGAASAVGSSLELDGASYQVVGIAPPKFAFPSDAELWIPSTIDIEGCGRGCRLTRAVARLAPGTSVEAANRSLEVVSENLAAEFPEDNYAHWFAVTPLAKRLVGTAQGGLLLLFGAVLLVLLIAAANLASLQIARSAGRGTEIALRGALGASRWRLTRLLLCETAVLGIAGGLFGASLAAASIRWIVALAPNNVPRLEEAVVDLRVLGFALLISLLASLCFGVLPAWRAGSRATRPTGGRGTVGGERSDLRLRNALLVAEVALSLVLLIGAGLLLKTYVGVLGVDLGFNKENTLSFFVGLPDERYEDPQKVVAFFDQLETELANLPAIESVGGILGRPFSGNSIGTSMRLMDLPEPEPGKSEETALRIVLPGYFETLQIPRLKGRVVNGQDRHGGAPVAVVNESFVRRYSSDRDPIGRQVLMGIDFGLGEEARTIVGVVADYQTKSLVEETEPEVFIPQAQSASIWMSVVMRMRGSGLEPWHEITAAMQRVDPLLAPRSKESLSEAVDRARGPARFYFFLLASFAVVALVLSAIGLYGVISYVVSKRSRELAIRMAVGAQAKSIVTLVLRQGLKPVLAGVALGLFTAIAATRLLGSLLFQVEPFDAATYGLVTLTLLAIAVIALYGPARRAGKVAPASALNK